MLLIFGQISGATARNSSCIWAIAFVMSNYAYYVYGWCLCNLFTPTNNLMLSWGTHVYLLIEPQENDSCCTLKAGSFQLASRYVVITCKIPLQIKPEIFRIVIPFIIRSMNNFTRLFMFNFKAFIMHVKAKTLFCWTSQCSSLPLSITWHYFSVSTIYNGAFLLLQWLTRR